MSFEFESNYDTGPGINYAKDHPFIPICVVAGYLWMCYYGRIFMTYRKPFDLRVPLAYWNLLLSMFSFAGMFRTIPVLIHNLHSMSLVDNLCTDPRISFGTGACGLWVQLFVYSKIPELLDTVFIIARKKPLIFLHWYHHVTVLLFCWHSYATEASTGLFFVTMNYSVHAAMYGYYYLMAIGAKPVWFNPVTITICQIAQMIVGTVLCVISFVLLMKGDENCAVKKENVIAGAIMYGSYLYLFCEFAVRRFVNVKHSLGLHEN
jgi:hypothetical protein